MAKETLAIPEEYLEDVIRILRVGISELDDTGIPIREEVENYLWEWCKDEEEYLSRLSREE